MYWTLYLHVSISFDYTSYSLLIDSDYVYPLCHLLMGDGKDTNNTIHHNMDLSDDKIIEQPIIPSF
jgi:hypothetical protein